MKKNLLGVVFLNIIFLGNVFGVNLLVLNRAATDIDFDNGRVNIKKNANVCMSRDLGNRLYISVSYKRLGSVRRDFYFEKSQVPEFGKLFVFDNGLIAILDEKNQKDPLYIHVKVVPVKGDLLKHALEIINLNEQDFIKKLEAIGYKKAGLFNLTEQEKASMQKIIDKGGCA